MDDCSVMRRRFASRGRNTSTSVTDYSFKCHLIHGFGLTPKTAARSVQLGLTVVTDTHTQTDGVQRFGLKSVRDLAISSTWTRQTRSCATWRQSALSLCCFHLITASSRHENYC